MKFNKRAVGQRKRKFENDMITGLFNLIWSILKWTIFLPFTILFKIFKNK